MRPHGGLWVQKRDHDWGTEIILGGVVDDHARTLFEGLRTSARRIRFTLRDVTRITSSGVVAFLRLVSGMRVDHEIEFAQCSSIVVDQLQMLEFSRYGRIVSFFATYVCGSCGEEDNRLLAVAELGVGDDGTVQAPSAWCSCGGPLIVDDSLDFVREHLVAARR